MNDRNKKYQLSYLPKKPNCKHQLKSGWKSIHYRSIITTVKKQTRSRDSIPAKVCDDRILERPYARSSVMRGSSGEAFMERGWIRGRRTDVKRRLDKRREDMRAADASQVKQAISVW